MQKIKAADWPITFKLFDHIHAVINYSRFRSHQRDLVHTSKLEANLRLNFFLCLSIYAFEYWTDGKDSLIFYLIYFNFILCFLELQVCSGINPDSMVRDHSLLALEPIHGVLRIKLRSANCKASAFSLKSIWGIWTEKQKLKWSKN